MKPKLLVVDDEEDVRQLLHYRFSAAGYEVLTAGSGMDALHQARRCLPELIILDIVLPDFDGFTVCDILRSQPSTAGTPVILLSCHSGIAIEGRAIEAGVRHCFKKSTGLDAIIECVRKTIEERRALDAARLAAD